jgi:hypothetical protein
LLDWECCSQEQPCRLEVSAERKAPGCHRFSIFRVLLRGFHFIEELPGLDKEARQYVVDVV